MYRFTKSEETLCGIENKEQNINKKINLDLLNTVYSKLSLLYRK